jgi:hypothetical protein
MFEDGAVFYAILHIDEMGGPIGSDMHISKASTEGREKVLLISAVYSVVKTT